MHQVVETLNVLLVEDSVTDAIIVEKVFQKIASEKFNLTRVARLQEGLNFLKTDRFDIILLDLSLPDSSGLESLNKIQNITTKVPIIVLTGINNDRLAIAALREGAQDYLIKDTSISNNIFGRLLKRAIDHAIERKQIIEQLRHSEALYRGVIEDQTEFICRFLPSGKISFVNRAFSRYLEQTASELIQQNFFLLINSEDLSIITPCLYSLSWENPQIEVEFRANRQQELRWQQWNIRAIYRDRELVEYQAVGQDISDRKQAETEKARLIASLHESKEKFRLVTNSAPALIWMTDNKGRLTFVNQSWLDFTGKSLEQALIEDWIISVHYDDRRNCQVIYRDALKKREHFALEYRMLNFEREYRWIFTTGVPRFDKKGQFAGFVCSGIDIAQRKKAENQLAQQAKRNYILAEITKRIHESLELNCILQTATEETNSFLQAEKIAICKIESTGNLKILSESTFATIGNHCRITPVWNLRFWQSEANLTRLQAGEIIVLDNIDKKASLADKSFLSLTGQQIELRCTAILVPIVVKKTLWGILFVEQCSHPRVWKVEETELLEQISLQLAIAIKQAELYQTIELNNQKLTELAVIDSLTRIANRRKFDEYLESEWLRLAREKSPLSIILCDIDHFKLYNDTYGHQAGDRCLYRVAQAIQKTVKRPADLTARYGGEEIAVILPNTTLEGAIQVAKNICQQIQALHIPHINSITDMYVTLSIGVAGCIPEHECSVETVVAKADSNLYEAKETGRNRVVS